MRLKKELSLFTKKKLEEINLISIVAGVSVSALKNIFRTNNIIRAMPNTPSIVGVGMTGLYMPKNVPKQKKVLAQDVFNLLGKTLLLKSEKKVDAVTAISGSGPAYFFKVIEILTETGEKFGLSKKEALLLVTQTAAGSISLLEKSQESPATLRKKVTSPGGTTEAALKTFEKKLLTEAITAGVFEARDRSLAICSELNSVFNKKT
jgi:pyrroline-5-carboxylate reductase